MNTFAFVVHPITIKQLKNFWTLTKFIPNFFLNSFLKKIHPFKISCIKNVRSIQGKEIQGYFIACPLLPKQMLELDEKFVLNRIIGAGHIAEELGAKILGLGGYTSAIADKGITISKNVKVAVTTGNSYTVALVIDSVLKASQIMQIDLHTAKAAIIGATGSIGDACTRILSSYIPELVITARHLDKLKMLKEKVIKSKFANVRIEMNAHEAIKDADIVITTTSAPDALIDVSEIKSGAVACDVSVPKNISNKQNIRDSVLIFDGGLAEYPGKIDFGINIDLPEGQIYGCIAETIVLALEDRFESFSLGNGLLLDKISEIHKLARKHGFKEVEIKR